MTTAALCCAAAAIAVAGCGSSKKDTNTTSSSGGVVQEPKPTQPISAVVSLLNKAIKDQSCAEFATIDFSQGRQDTTPGAPPTGSECKFMKQALKGSKDLRFTHGVEYGNPGLPLLRRGDEEDLLHDDHDDAARHLEQAAAAVRGPREHGQPRTSRRCRSEGSGL